MLRVIVMDGENALLSVEIDNHSQNYRAIALAARVFVPRSTRVVLYQDGAFVFDTGRDIVVENEDVGLAQR